MEKQTDSFHSVRLDVASSEQSLESKLIGTKRSLENEEIGGSAKKRGTSTDVRTHSIRSQQQGPQKSINEDLVTQAKGDLAQIPYRQCIEAPCAELIVATGSAIVEQQGLLNYVDLIPCPIGNSSLNQIVAREQLVPTPKMTGQLTHDQPCPPPTIPSQSSLPRATVEERRTTQSRTRVANIEIATSLKLSGMGQSSSSSLITTTIAGTTTVGTLCFRRLSLITALCFILHGLFPVFLAILAKFRPHDPELFDDRIKDFLSRNKHIIPPKSTSTRPYLLSTDVTLRSYLERNDSGFSLAMAPAFFGFYGYFGILAAWDEHLASYEPEEFLRSGRVRSVAGASAGAMAAVLLSAGVKPRSAADFCTTVTLEKFADFPGVGGLFKGHLFEKLMEDFLTSHIQGSQENRSLLLLQNAQYPVAVTAFCLQNMAGKTLTTGSMARAARASATFPLLFQPVGWLDSDSALAPAYYTLIDGGINDTAGVVGLEALDPSIKGTRVVNLKVEPFMFDKPPGPDEIPDVQEVLSISIQNLPQCGPWAMENGPVAVEAAYQAVVASLDLPLFVQESGSHFD